MLSEQLNKLLLQAAVFLLLARSIAAADAAGSAGAPTELGLEEFLQLVLEHNESLQVNLLELEISRKRNLAEWGVFEPELVAAYSRVENDRQNTAQQQRSLGVTFFHEKNNVYDGGLEALVPTGARIRLGYNLQDLRNNLQDPASGLVVTNAARREWLTFVGVTLSQPLLKNAWNSATLASIRLAALASDIAYQEYRRQMMLILSTAEASYWNLYLTQEQVRFFRESVALAEDLVRDNRARAEAGKGSDLETLQAEAGLALRKSKLSEAEQKYRETSAQLRTLMSLPAGSDTFELKAREQPNPLTDLPSFQLSGEKVLTHNPDYLIQQKKVAQEDVRVAYSKNQRLPQLDLKASYGLNGLGHSPSLSWDQAQSGDFPSLSVGVEMRVPLGGGMKSRNELAAARLKKKEALLQFKDVETQVLNAVMVAVLKIKNSRETIENYRSVVRFDEDLLKTQMARLDVGKVESRKVLEVEGDLFEAKNSVLEATVQHARARLELALVEGELLEARNLDLPQKELEQKTGQTFRRAGGSDERFKALMEELKKRYAPPPGQKRE